MAESKEELKSLLMKLKEEREKPGLKINIKKTMASGPIISWQMGKMETVTYFILLGSKITADGDCSHEIKMPAPWKKSYDQHTKKQRHHFTNKGQSSQSYSHVWM